LFPYRVGQGKKKPVELLEVFHIGNHYQEAQDKKEPVKKIQFYIVGVRK
jgi:hypothetical protein